MFYALSKGPGSGEAVSLAKIIQAFEPVWKYRGFILSSVKRDFQAKYRNTIIGPIWAMIGPLSQIIVYSLIFSNIMQAKLPGNNDAFAYTIFLCSGILAWGFFLDLTMKLQNVFIENANVIKKISFPKLCLPIIAILNSLVSYTIIQVIFIVFLIFSGAFPGLVIISILPLTFVLIIFAVGLGLLLGLINVFFRDVGHFFGIFSTFWFWLTPIVYPVTVLPTYIREAIKWNPLTGYMQAVQEVFLNQFWPSWNSVVGLLFSGSFLCYLGYILYERHRRELMDEI